MNQVDKIIMDNIANKLSNYDAEKAVLGAILLQKDIYYYHSESLFPDLFQTLSNRYTFQAIKNVVESGSEIDIVTVTQNAMENAFHKIVEQQQPGANLIPHIASLTANISSTGHIENHIEILTKYFQLRKIQEMGLLIGQKCTELEGPDDIISYINNEIVEINIVKKDEFEKEKVIQETVKSMEGVDLTKIIKSGIHKLDDFIFGFEAGDSIIIAGAPSMGKTAFALRLFLNFISFGYYPAYFSLEMKDTQLTSRLIAMESDISLGDIRKRNLAPNQWENVHIATAKLERYDYYIDDKARDLYQICNKIRKYVIKYNTRVAIIDYLQLIKVNLNKSSNREQEVATISRELKEIATLLGIVIIALSQLNRGVSTRTNKRPMLSDLRESGSIEQDADMVLFPYRPAYYNHFETSIPYVEDAEIIIGKGRGTGIGIIPMRFKSTRTLYYNGTAEEQTEVAF